MGVKPSDIRWRAGGIYETSRTEKVTFTIPEDVELERIGPGKTLSKMLADGEIDALIGPRAPSCFHESHPDITHLFPDFIEKEKDYFRRTKIFPIMHLLAIYKNKARELPYGVEKNRNTLEPFLRYHTDQGLSERRLTIDEIFVPSTLARSRI